MNRALVDTPLDDDHAQRLGAVGARLHERLGAIVDCLQKEERTAKGLATRFNIEGVVARRIVRTLAGPAGLITLTRLPSPDHVRAFTNLAELKGVHKQACADVRTALDELAAASSDIGGGRARLTKRIRATLREGKA